MLCVRESGEKGELQHPYISQLNNAEASWSDKKERDHNPMVMVVDLEFQ